MALITLASRSHVLGQLFDVLFPYSRKADLQVCQFFIRQENILVTAIGCLLYTSHPTQDRPLSIQEYARIQQFPDDWKFMGTSVAK